MTSYLKNSGDRFQIDQYIRCLVRFLGNKNFKLDTSALHNVRFAIKLNIEYDNETGRREESYFNGKVGGVE